MARPNPTPPPAPPKAGGEFNLTRWARTHQGQAAAAAGAVLVAAYALYQRRKQAKSSTAGGSVPAGAMATIQPYDPATAATGGFYTGGGASGGSPDSAGGMPTGPDPQTAAQLANLQAQLGALSAGQQAIGTQLSTGANVGAPPTAAVPAPSPTGSNASLFGIESNVAGIFSAAGVPVTYGDSTETGQQRLQRIAQAIASGQRTYSSVTNDVQWLAQQQKAAATGSTG